MEYAGIITGLGNPGQRYQGTRHNFGFRVLDALVASADAYGWSSAETVKASKDFYELWRMRHIASSTVWLFLKPLTFMNLSGKAVAKVIRYYNLEISRLVVVHDELDLPLGRIRLKYGGGWAGHNGVGSIAELLGTRDFYRLRLGIGRPARVDISSYVLQPFAPEERELVQELVPSVIDGLSLFAEKGFELARQQLNSFTP